MPNSNSGDLTVSQIIGNRPSDLKMFEHPMIVGTNRVGIEIELENMPALSRSGADLKHWQVIGDGSLRNDGVEFITRYDGIGGDVLFNAVQEVDAFIKQHDPDPSWRCSTHIHLDVRDLTLEQLRRLIVAYAFFERYIFRESGWWRYKSNFCLPLGLAQNMCTDLSFSFKEDSLEHFIYETASNWPKYTALNLRTLQRLGTLEFRMPQPTYESVKLLKVANRFLSLKDLAVNWEGTITDMVESLCDAPKLDIFPKSTGMSRRMSPEDISSGYAEAMNIINMADLMDAPIRASRSNDNPFDTSF